VGSVGTSRKLCEEFSNGQSARRTRPLHYLSKVERMDSGSTTAERGQAFPLKLATWSDEIAATLWYVPWLAGTFALRTDYGRLKVPLPGPPMGCTHL